MLERLLQDSLKSQVFVLFGRIGAPVFESFVCREKKVSELIRSLTYYNLSRVDDLSGILLDCGLDDVSRKAISAKVHQGVSCCEVFRGSLFEPNTSLPYCSCFSRSDGDNQDDAHDDGKSSG